MGEHTTQLEFPFEESKPAAVIGLMGRRGSGKDTVAKVAKELDDSVITLALGDFVKHEVAGVTNHSHVWVETHKEQLRPLLQAWSTEYRRNLCDENYWLSKLATMLKFIPKESVVIVTDIRFENEARFIKECGGVLVRVQRDMPHDDPVDQHPSETWVDTCKPDAVLLNDVPTPEQLRKGVEKILEWVLDGTALDGKKLPTNLSGSKSAESVN